MARLRFRDRFWSRPVARAVTSPSAILATGAAAAVGVVAFGPIGILAGIVGYAARVALAIPRKDLGASREVDPFAVGEPWRQFVSDALSAQRRYEEAVRTTRTGPLRDRLDEIGDRLDTGVQEVWRIAQRGHVLARARKQLDPERPSRELAALLARGAPPAGSAEDETARALQAQIDSAARLDATIADTHNRLRLMDARLDESVTRAVELSVQADDAALGGLGADVDGLVTEMEALRLALEDAGRAAGTSPPTLPDPGSASAT